ncbi:peptidylprolyl isomerase fpr3 [Recurvomyces mirabilis]|uniref:peptidylprolyl isomerase n=1 Tax=Recurvomyces mirabilis TaxID=574656 RepID=A0AAE0WMP3_9PEZI|nr:peptidylprolyl isomerase fpr3 [Recurvomyces mirabilis]KAK5151283.1 peptidylprolyl isomerase fpr3 [Recurvomyces mirabilis]
MTSMIPMAMFGQEVPPGDVAIKAEGDIPAAFRITMAAIDPSAVPEGEEGQPLRATLKVIRQPLGMEDDYDSEDDEEGDEFDVDRMDAMFAGAEDDEDDDEDEDLAGGPSDPAKSKKARVEAMIRKLAEEEGMDVDDDEEDEDDEEDAKPNGVNGVKSGKSKGKMPVDIDEDEDEEDDEDDDDLDSEDYVEEFVICTLDPEKNYQQPLDITIGEDERVFFKVSGTHAVYLTGNYVEPAAGGPGMYDPEDDEDEDYDLEPDMDELEDDEEDELDDMEDPRITEIDEEEVAPKLIEMASKKADKKGNKRPAEDEAQTLDEMIKDASTNGEAKLSKKQLKKMKKNDGTAAAVEDKSADVASSAKSDKKVQFAKELEQGPTPTKDTKTADKPAAAAKKDKNQASLGPKTVQGVTLDDKKLGTGPAAKAGDRVGMRYIGKLQKDNKVFDSNKKGKPFTFKLGSGEVIKGWDIGIQGMSVGGERRVTIPAHLAYGSKGAGRDIPPNSTLVFDVKLLELNKSK